MAGNLINALWITLIGMGLVFIVILALWGMMALIVRLTAERETGGEEAAAFEEPAALQAPALEAASISDRKRRAAAAAVAAALAMQAHQSAESLRVTEPAGSVSAWQAVQRASQLSQRMSSSRKKVVR